ncbi:long-chain fatty acid--CoA ligase [Gordonia sp. CPCC 205515]|uniref:AMP-dependent synthetase/ligase n=1 Tax=Gordonia sp. CPCC 205515 TaxID=3140791 RepID=UPI003AF3DAC8
MDKSVDRITYPHQSGVAVATLPEAFQETIRMRPSAVALRTVGGMVEITWAEYGRRVELIAQGLVALGIGHGDTVGIMLTNRPEFHLIDTAALHLGAIPFSIYNTSSPEQIEYLFGDAGNTVVVTEQMFLPAIRAASTAAQTTIIVDGIAEGAMSLADLEQTPAPDGFDFEASWRAVQPDDLATLIYTSGTTGPPKGVEITHRSFVACGLAFEPIVPYTFDDRVISYLPAAHMAERVACHLTNIVCGAQVTTVPDPREVAVALPDVRPTVFFGVPRVWQKIRAGIDAALTEETSPVKKHLVSWALAAGAASADAIIDGRTPSRIDSIQHTLADKLVLQKIRATLGMDELRVGVSGAAAIPPAVLRFFLGLGIPVLEGWGMSETSAAGTMNSAADFKIGSVGKPLPGIEVKLADDGELLIRGAVIMRGYRNQPQKTADTIDADGWLSTGDIATIDDGFVTIVDRKKELIINGSGKNMSPTNIENAMKAASSLIGQVAAIGDEKPFISALIVLDPDAAAARAKMLDLTDADVATLSAHAAVTEEVAAAIREGNGTLSRVEQIKRFTILPAAWDPGGDELTPTMKLRRKPIAAKYATEIGALYDESPGTGVIDLS